jgi:hypothetical protein
VNTIKAALTAAAAKYDLRSLTAGPAGHEETLILPQGTGHVSPVLWAWRDGTIHATNGEEVALDEVDAFLAAYKRHPDWLSGALLDEVRTLTHAPGGSSATT